MSFRSTRMFGFITETWNPLGGMCPHRCIYCWSRRLEKRFSLKKYRGEPRLIELELKRKFKPGSFVFVQDMTDLFAENVPEEMIEAVLNHIAKFPKTRFLLLTKNPKRYLDFLHVIPSNCVLGVTLETDGEEISYSRISLAPHPADRINAIIDICSRHAAETMVSIEPILQFNHEKFLAGILSLSPKFVAVGYDNYGNRLPEPPLEKTLRLINTLKNYTAVYCKTIRKAWWEK